MVRKIREYNTGSQGGLIGVIGRALLRLLLLIIALVVAGEYGSDLHNASKSHAHADSRWVYAEVVAGISIVTTIVYQMPFTPASKMFPWDIILFVLWAALFGVFGKLFMHVNCNGDGQCNDMKVAMWFDMLGMIFWFLSAAVGGLTYLSNRHGRTIFTGRATV